MMQFSSSEIVIEDTKLNDDDVQTIKEDSDLISESDISSSIQQNVILNDSSQEDNSQISVRSISKTCQFSLERLKLNLSINQIETYNHLLNNLFLKQSPQQQQQRTN